MFLKASPEVIDVRRVDLSQFYTNVEYTEALSLPEINWCLNRFFDETAAA